MLVHGAQSLLAWAMMASGLCLLLWTLAVVTSDKLDRRAHNGSRQHEARRQAARAGAPGVLPMLHGAFLDTSRLATKKRKLENQHAQARALGSRSVAAGLLAGASLWAAGYQLSA